MSTAANPLSQMVADPDFAKMPVSEQRKALAAHDPGFGQMDDANIGHFVFAHQPTSFGQNVAKGMGFDVEKLSAAQKSGGTLGGAGEVGSEALSGLGNWLVSVLKDPAHIADPIQGMASALTKGLGLPDKPGEGFSTPSAGQTVGALANIVGGAEGAGKAGSLAGKAEGMAQTAGKEIIGEGPSKAALLADAHEHALRVQEHIKDVAANAHDSAQQAMSAVAQKVDASNPVGFDKGMVRDTVKEAMGNIVKIPEKMPPALSKLMEEAPESGGPTVGGRKFDLTNADDLKAYQRMKASGAFTPEETARMEGTGPSDSLSFEQLKQMRSDLGRQLGSLEGPVAAGAKTVYSKMSDMLRGAAKDAGVEGDWLSATAQWKQFMDDFYRSPLKKTLSGGNAADIMGPIAGKSAEQVRGILDRYKDQGADVDAINSERHRFGAQRSIERFSQPSKWDLIIAGINPKMAALRLAAPYVMRKPWFTKLMAGEGMTDVPNIRPNKIYPNKAAALKAKKP